MYRDVRDDVIASLCENQCLDCRLYAFRYIHKRLVFVLPRRHGLHILWQSLYLSEWSVLPHAASKYDRYNNTLFFIMSF